MVNTDKLRGAMRERHVTQEDLAKALGVTEKTVTTRFRTGIFRTSEIDKIARHLNLSKEEAIAIFFG